MDQRTPEDLAEEQRRRWVAEIVEEGINASLAPLQTQIAEMHQHLAAATPVPPHPDAALQAQINELQERLAAVAPPPQPDLAGASQPPPATAGPSSAAPPTASPDAPPATPLRTRPLPNPTKFSGKRNEYAAWQQEMRDKLALDRHLFPSAHERWYLIGSCLEAGPKRVAETFYAQGGYNGERNPEDLMKYLDSIYEDVTATSRAANALRTLRQKDTDSFAYFLTRFEQTIAKAGGGGWDDAVKIVFLEGALNEQLRRALVTVQLPTGFSDWVQRVQEVAGRLEGLRSGRRSELPARRHGNTRDNDGDVPMTGMNKLGERSKGRGGPSRGNAAGKTRTGADTRRCYQCQEVGHIARNCAQRGEPRAAQLQGEQSSDEEPEEQLGESDNDNTLSGKE